MNRLGKFMLRLIGMYIPFVIVILGIGACSYIYKDELLGSAKVGAGWDRIEEETVPDEPELPEDVGNDEQSPASDDIVTEPVSTDNGDNDQSGIENLPAIGECVCPETDGSK
jgi:hypothetical protein